MTATPMKTNPSKLGIMLAGVLALTVALLTSPAAFAQFDDSSVRDSTAQRIFRSHSVTVDPKKYSLSALLDIEARLGTARRLKAYSVEMDYNAYSLSQLLDAEARVSTAARIKRALGVQLDWRQESLSSLLAQELSLARQRRATRPDAVAPAFPLPQAPQQRAPNAPPRGPVAGAVARRNGAEKHWIKRVIANGAVLELEDGSLWEVDSIDRIDSALWLPLTNVVLVDGEKIINVDDNETVEVKRVR